MTTAFFYIVFILNGVNGQPQYEVENMQKHFSTYVECIENAPTMRNDFVKQFKLTAAWHTQYDCRQSGVPSTSGAGPAGGDLK
jgi:hypothetical protein